MAAYVIVDLEVTDPAAFQDYRNRVGSTVELYGGKYIVRGGHYEPMEGDWRPHTLVVVEFASIEQAWWWHHSPEYAPLLDLRKKAAITQAVVVQGVEPTP